MRTVLLDNEAVTVLADPAHRKHRGVVAHLAGVVTRRRKGAPSRVVVATAVRVEAGWNQIDPAAAAAGINRYRVTDAPLDGSTANVAAGIVSRTGVSVADAHSGAVALSLTSDDIVVLTSDPHDMIRAASPRAITALRI